MITDTLLRYLRSDAAGRHIRHYFSGCYAGGRWDELAAALPSDVISTADAGLTSLLSLGVTLRGRFGTASAESIIKLHDLQGAITEMESHRVV
ncbi:hypothetical protein [Euzebya rosea]|uniref:hypothetical protein n=1 Tax=Euzebya rosea TaxID=2052804 RepID=UPI000D3EAFAE|nr:hypothetical protein [Euzebya rosea]